MRASPGERGEREGGMTEAINKLQPDRTVQLRGFDHLGASAAVHNATPSGFTVSGTFRDPADFAVVVLYDADNFYEHPRLKYLPDFDFSGLTLQFDVRYEGLMPLNSRKYPTIDWPYLDVEDRFGQTSQIRLSDHAEVIDMPDAPACGEFHIEGADVQGFDRLTIWYQNLAFDYIVPGSPYALFDFVAGNPGAQHTVVAGTRAYGYEEQPGDSAAQIVAALADRVNGVTGGNPADPNVAATATGSQLRIQTKLGDGSTIDVTCTGYPTVTLSNVSATTVCREMANMINGVDYAVVQSPYGLRATATGTTLRIETVEGGYDANFITLYAVSKNDTLKTAEEKVALRGGASTAVLRVTLNFDALNATDVRTMWLTFAPRLAGVKDDGTLEGEPGEWRAEFSNWTVTGPAATRRLRVAGPESVRVNSSSPSCVYAGSWTDESGFYNGNFARRAAASGSQVTVRYYCGREHELWLGSALWSGAGQVAMTLDGAPLESVNLRLERFEPVVTRRRVAASVPAGEHVVTFQTISGSFVFDFVEAAVPGDVPSSVAARANASPALDYSTDHTYKLPPARILWMFDKLGYRGPVNEYIGVFWWNERKSSGGHNPSRRLQFSGEFKAGDQVILTIGGQACGKTVFPHESREVIVKHFMYLINATYVGIWAKADDDMLELHARSSTHAYEYDIEISVESVAGSTGAVSGAGRLDGGSMGEWVIDVDAQRALNRGASAWHGDFYAQCAARGFSVTTAVSMELVNPPAPFAAVFADGSPVVTSVGFADLHSTHCAFRGDMLAYQKRVFEELAELQSMAGATPSLQCGEYSWWYFSNGSGMAYYDDETAAQAQLALGRPLHVFAEPDDNPAVNGGADALFLRNRLRDYVSALMAHVRGRFPNARFEVLFPYDVNHPCPRGVNNLGGRMNRYVNLPAEWESASTAGFNVFKLEALDFGAWSRDIDLTRECQEFAVSLGWPRNKLRMMTPVFRAGYPWHKEAENALTLGYNAVNLWAFDHVCLFGLEWPTMLGTSRYQG